ncbi:hypothetical protein HHI36_019050 [Cryptolaemus montrouzieri]|uniref:Uncharacterized protein n=1 Tax=Cryptolaemus montrouzieri TaxID=559131 RepID=A0ABD2P2G6_9CUCU
MESDGGLPVGSDFTVQERDRRWRRIELLEVDWTPVRIQGTTTAEADEKVAAKMADISRIGKLDQVPDPSEDVAGPFVRRNRLSLHANLYGTQIVRGLQETNCQEAAKTYTK